MKILFLFPLLILPFLLKAQLGLTEQEIKNKYSYATFKIDYVSGNMLLKYSDIPNDSKYITSDNITSNTSMTFYFDSNNICKIILMTINDTQGIKQTITDCNEHDIIISPTEWIIPYFSKGTEYLKLEYFMGMALFYDYYK